MRHSDFPLEELDGAVREVILDGLEALAFKFNELAPPLTRQDRREMLVSFLDNWANGHNGGTDRPPPGLQRYPIPRGQSITDALETHRIGEGLSTTSLVPHGSIWLPQDRTFELISAQMPTGDPL